MKRRSFLALSASMGAMALGCGSGLHGGLKRVASSAPDPSNFALLPDNPGFRAVGSWTGSGSAPLLAELNLNINDFMRPQREAQAVGRWLNKVDALGLHPMELSFTGHVLTAFNDVAPQLIARAKASKHTITQHYRLLTYKHLRSTDREIYYTDPATLQIDRSRPGPVVLIQKTFGVTPRDEGGAIGELLRRQWKEGSETHDLMALGWGKLQRKDQIAHPDRIVAWALPDIDATDAHPHVEAYLRIRRLERDISAGSSLDRNQLADHYVDLYRWSQVAREMGFDVSAIAGLPNLVDISKLPSFKAGIANFGPTDQEVASMQHSISQDAEAVASSLETVMAGLAQRTRSLPTIGAELAFKLSRLSDEQVWVTRLAWHASNDYTLESWSQHMSGDRRGQTPLPLTPAHERPADQQQAIQDAADSILEGFASSGRLRMSSAHNDTQWASENAAQRQYPAVLGISLAQAPADLDSSAIDALASSQGIQVRDDSQRTGRDQRAGRGQHPPRASSSGERTRPTRHGGHGHRQHGGGHRR